MKAEGIVQVPECLPDWPDPVKNREKYWAKVEDLTDRLYSLGNQPHKRRALDEVCTELNKVTRLYSDPAGGGKQRDEELAFRTFTKVLSRLIANWTDFGEIHDQDIIPALMDPDRKSTRLNSSH